MAEPVFSTRTATPVPQGPPPAPASYILLKADATRLPHERGKAHDGSDSQGACVAGAEDAVVVLGCGPCSCARGDLFLATAAAIPARRRSAGPSGSVVVMIPTGSAVLGLYCRADCRRGLSDHVVMADEVFRQGPSMADVFFLASRLDPLPNVTIDAAMEGLPIVCFDGASGIAEFLQRDPTTSLTVVPHLDTDAAARRIIELAEDEKLRRRIGRATRDLARATFDMDSYVAGIDEIGAQAIDSMRRRHMDFETLRDDPMFDAEFFTGVSEGVSPRCCGSLTHWWHA